MFCEEKVERRGIYMQLCIIAKATCVNFYLMGMDGNTCNFMSWNYRASQCVDCFKCSNITVVRHMAEILFWLRSLIKHLGVSILWRSLKNKFSDCLQRLGAQQVVFEGVNRHVWENTWSEFTLDLHLMSSGAAQAMVHAWLLAIRSLVFNGRPLPEFVRYSN